MQRKEQWIALDAAGTLFQTSQPVESIYAACFSRLGFHVAESVWKHALGKTFRTIPDPVYPKQGAGEKVEREWWSDLVLRSAHEAGVHTNPEIINRAFSELYDHYGKGSSWKLFPETESALHSLKSAGNRLAITSNFDSRIHAVLQELGIARQFDHILTSADVRARKPSPRILEKLIATTSSSASDCCLAGDCMIADEGAAGAAGIAFYHIHRPHRSLTDFALWHQAVR